MPETLFSYGNLRENMIPFRNKFFHETSHNKDDNDDVQSNDFLPNDILSISVWEFKDIYVPYFLRGNKSPQAMFLQIITHIPLMQYILLLRTDSGSFYHF